MENKTRFDLNSSIEIWRRELVAQINLTAENRRELETHLLDAIAGFQQRGLNDEESFWLARRRVGHPQQLGEEFIKADPTAVWGEHVLWMTGALLAVSLWTGSAGIIDRLCLSLISGHTSAWGTPQRIWYTLSFQIVFAFLLKILPLCVLAVLLWRGNTISFSRVGFLLQSRSRVVATALAWLLLNESLSVFHWLDHPNFANGSTAPVWANLVTTLLWPLTLIGLMAWLMTPATQKFPEPV